MQADIFPESPPSGTRCKGHNKQQLIPFQSLPIEQFERQRLSIIQINELVALHTYCRDFMHATVFIPSPPGARSVIANMLTYPEGDKTLAEEEQQKRTVVQTNSMNFIAKQESLPCSRCKLS